MKKRKMLLKSLAEAFNVASQNHRTDFYYTMEEKIYFDLEKEEFAYINVTQNKHYNDTFSKHWITVLNVRYFPFRWVTSYEESEKIADVFLDKILKELKNKTKSNILI